MKHCLDASELVNRLGLQQPEEAGLHAAGEDHAGIVQHSSQRALEQGPQATQELARGRQGPDSHLLQQLSRGFQGIGQGGVEVRRRVVALVEPWPQRRVVSEHSTRSRKARGIPAVFSRQVGLGDQYEGQRGQRVRVGLLLVGGLPQLLQLPVRGAAGLRLLEGAGGLHVRLKAVGGLADVVQDAGEEGLRPQAPLQSHPARQVIAQEEHVAQVVHQRHVGLG
ncbi:hypothetical protein HRbin24_02181 [bacterium HR24]|nr:hypothetical protein HRbin24_02181 [bacterium HR24]